MKQTLWIVETRDVRRSTPWRQVPVAGSIDHGTRQKARDYAESLRTAGLLEARVVPYRRMEA